jgi:hypothetical protein
MQTQWPGLGPAFDLTSLDAAAGDGRQLWHGGPYGTSLPPQPLDAIARSWWSCGTGNANGAPFGGSSAASGFGALIGIVSGLVNALQQLANALMSGNAPAPGQSSTPLPGGAQQRFENVDVSSNGDPHIAEVGTTEGRGTNRAIDDHWDSMTSHDDLVHSNQIEGGYRVSTAVTQPGANGITANQSATVHANFDQDSITMNRDGSYAIYDNGEQVALGKGESATLSGGERVDVNQDGSLIVSASDGHGGTIATTMRSTGGGVDVTTHGHDIALGGDAIAHGVPQAQPGHKSQGPHHPHHERHPLADAAAAAAN